MKASEILKWYKKQLEKGFSKKATKIKFEILINLCKQ